MRQIIALLILVSLIVGCDSTPQPAIPSAAATVVTPYENQELGITASLPGRDWTIDREANNEGWQLLVSERNDGKVIFAVARLKESPPADDLAFRLYVRKIADSQLLPPIETTDSDFHGYKAVRAEGVGDKQIDWLASYRTVEYIFISNNQILMVRAAAPIAEWDAGGKAMVEGILDSVRIK